MVTTGETMTVIDTAVFEKLKTRMKAKFPVLLEGYLRDAKTYLETIERNLPAGDLTELIGAAHSLKSASGLLGVTGVQEAALKVEYGGKDIQQAGEQNGESLRPHYETLRTRFAEAETELAVELEKARTE
jgi:HPt (histidine-containing phosphotransfer) domain-containing protein